MDLSFISSGPGGAKAPDDQTLAQARDHGIKNADRFRGFGRQATFVGAVIIAILILIIGGSAPKGISSTVTLLALIGSLGSQYAIGYAADKKKVSDVIARQEEVSMTVLLAVSLLGLGLALAELAVSNAVAAAGIGIIGWVAITLSLGYAYLKQYLPQKKEAFEFLAGFEELPATEQDELQNAAETNDIVDSWLAQVRHRKTALTYHEARYLKDIINRGS